MATTRDQPPSLSLKRRRNKSRSAAELRRRAQSQLRRRPPPRSRSLRSIEKSERDEATRSADARVMLHELQVHQVELEMQNTELEDARERLESLLEKYTELYDLAPVGYCSMDAEGRILEINLTGAELLGVGRSGLPKRHFSHFLAPASRPAFLAFLDRLFDKTGKQVCEAMLLRSGSAPFWASLHGAPVMSEGPREWCRVAFSDITSLKQAEEAQRRMEALAAMNQELRREIVRRKLVEEALRTSEKDQRRLLELSRQMQERLRGLSRQVLHVQEEERKRISRELHDQIAQTLVGINIRLSAFRHEAAGGSEAFQQKLDGVRSLVVDAVEAVHRFARELRPPVLDDLGLIPALTVLLKEFAKRTAVRVRLTAYSGVERLDIQERTVLYRVAYEALNNVARHAEASRLDVNISQLGQWVCMKIQDNGKAFDVEKVFHARGNKRLGLIGMRERVEMVQGILAVTSKPGQGTTIEAQVPLVAAVRKSGSRT